MNNTAHTNYRAIIRFSLDDDDQSRVRNSAIAKLKDIGFTNEKTGAWETTGTSIIEIKKKVCEILEDIAVLSADQNHPMTLDHIWLYIDKVSSDTPPPCGS